MFNRRLKHDPHANGATTSSLLDLLQCIGIVAGLFTTAYTLHEEAELGALRTFSRRKIPS